IARWDKLTEYYRLLEKQAAGTVKVVDMGPTEMGNPFLLVIVTSAANQKNLEQLRQNNLKLSDPRGIPEAEARKLAAASKPFACMTMSMHASEIGGAQMSPELVYDLVTKQDAETRRILDNVVFLLIPSFNPDGQIMVTDWYNKYLGTEYEGSSLPWLYNKYIGHDNNRDALTMNTKESQYVGRLLFTEWKPQAYFDFHHMGSYGARMFFPPYAEPIRPLADPLVWTESAWYGGEMANMAAGAGLSGVMNNGQYSGWGHFGFHWITPFHNIAGMLSEAASARLATPLFIDPSQLTGRARNQQNPREPQMNFPDPWPGGWWTLRGIVERQKVGAWALLNSMARNAETIVWDTYLKATRQTERGANGKPAAYAISAAQHDTLTNFRLVNALLAQGIEVMRAAKGFSTPGGVTYPPGSFYVSLAQPKMGLIRYLLGETHYPDNEWTRQQDGTPIRPYDMGQDVLAEFMGIKADPLDEAIDADFAKVSVPIVPAGKVEKGPAGYVMDGRLNDAFKAVNLLFDRNVAVRRVDATSGGLRAGDFLVGPGAPEAALAEVARVTGVDFQALKAEPGAVHALKRMRVGMYQRYRGGNMDEGWTRWIFEQFAFQFKQVYDAEIKKGDLSANYDVFIFADDSTSAITGEPAAARDGGFRGARFEGVPDTTPPEYRSGIGSDGVNAIKEFVRNGGTLVTLGGATDFAISKLGLPVRNVVEGLSTKEFFCPGSTLRVAIDNTHPLAYGMPSEGLVLFHYSPAFDVLATEFNDRNDVVVRYADRDVERSGWLNGEKHIAGKTAMASIAYGRGRVVLIGFRTQNRAQTLGTYKFLFNALVTPPK
ncbi:MAG TPA: M14 family metallopeptidase, partial [Vicinamibacterales bacterium]|nr:M14 family metallopeptidase [Vicinamibacterales bacterium]